MINRLETMNGHLHWKVNFLYGVLNLYDYNFFLYLVTFILFGMYCYLVAYNDKWIKKNNANIAFVYVLQVYLLVFYLGSDICRSQTCRKNVSSVSLDFIFMRTFVPLCKFFGLFWKPRLVSLCLIVTWNSQ